MEIEEARTPRKFTVADVEHDSHAVVTIDVQMDERGVRVDLDGCDSDIQQVLDRSVIDAVSGVDWLEDTSRRPTRQACLLNLLASLRSRPTTRAPLVELVHDIYYVGNDRLYTKVDRALVDSLQTLSNNPTKPFYAEGSPKATVHGRLLSSIPEQVDIKTQFKELLSFRGEGRPSMQAVVAVPPPDLPHTYAEFDIDLEIRCRTCSAFSFIWASSSTANPRITSTCEKCWRSRGRRTSSTTPLSQISAVAARLSYDGRLGA